MIDIPATLDPDSGIALRYAVTPPHDGDPLWSSAVELHPVEGFEGIVGSPAAAGSAGAGGAADAGAARAGGPASAGTATAPDTAGPGTDVCDLPLSARFAGASGASRVDALLRGAGEAVERRALHPSAAHPARFGAAAGLAATTLYAHHPDHALSHPDAETAALSWYEARDLDTGVPVLVPADLVDWPARRADLFDPSPSGAAAGASHETALAAAMIEVTERDALTVAWGRLLRLPTYVPSPADTGLSAMWRRARAEGLDPVLARIPTAVPGLWCMTGFLIDPEGPGALAAVGMKASTRPAEAAAKAFQEAWQVRAALRALRGQGETGRVAPIVTEHDRLSHMLTRPAYDSVRDWVAGFREPDPLPAPSPARDLGAEEIRRALTADGAGLLAVDLTPRLPSAVAAMGWHVVKVLAPGYQSLRMDETHRWSWHLPRLASAPERTGCAAGLDDPREAAPHPLP
ncbi:ribosomal protein S12 methylthiotransferase accessory factor [Streptomyces achromogenes]|uniref:YcaO-like family protein n=1 Tax=Streptomyces achromogenes TaxID=67255 RepID=UPI00278AC9F4|nr:YcaO-like family protein [Streptomyces achromogenes]MDQ0832090.1 ribosomal protein S12 methylthiotransferase accessory factor [Streptomyces achromogenes]